MLSARLLPIPLLGAAARTAMGAGEAVPLWLEHGDARGVALVLDVTAAATASGDTLDVFVQTRPDGGNWMDVVAFTQVLGDGGAKRFVAKVASEQALSAFEAAATLSAGSVRHLLGRDWRVRWAISEADAASFTFSVTAVPQ